jgi:PhzF family phenazine biosynthesis protein
MHEGQDGAALEVLRLAAFTTDPAGGNPAGVVIAPTMPEAAEMQRIAADVGYSETAFLAPADPSAIDPAATGGPRRFDVRYFSPLAEVPFCGHATIAAGVVFGERIGVGSYEFATVGGPVVVEVVRGTDGPPHATLTSVPPRIEPASDRLVADALDALHWTPEELDPSLPPRRAYAGAWHLILAVRERSRLARLDYAFEPLKAAMLEADLTTVQLIWRESSDRFHARDPFPVAGVVEDPATGAAAAAFGAYLRDLGLASAPFAFTIEQGTDMGRPSVLKVELVVGELGVRVSGTAVKIPDPR